MDIGSALTIIKGAGNVWDVFRRPKIIVGHSFTTSFEIGNTISVANLSKTPILIDYWEVVWIKRKLFGSEEKMVCCPEGPDITNITIQPHTKFLFEFSEQDYFSTGHEMQKHGRLYIRLHICGRKYPITKFVYDPNK